MEVDGGGLFSFSGDYGLSISRDLLYLDNDTVGTGFSKIVNDVFFGGRDGSYSQKVTVNSKPKIPDILDIPKYLDITAGYSVGYDWHNIFQGGDLGKSARWGNNISLSSTFRLKSLTDPWFQSLSEPSTQEQAPDVQPIPKADTSQSGKDTTAVKQTEKSKGKSLNPFVPLKLGLKYLIKVPFLDFETINIQFTQQNGMASGAVRGTTGFQNFWGRSPFQGSLVEYGPSRLYQLGLISDPSGTLEYVPTKSFPFVGWKVRPGLRGANGIFSDQFNQANSITLHTTKPLWEGAMLDINWKVGWQFSKTTQLSTVGSDIPQIKSVNTAGRIERSFLSLPPVFFLKYLNSDLKDVAKKYAALKDQKAPDIALSESFEKGLEALPFLTKVLGQYVPRANWSFRWDGLQKFSFLGSTFKQLQLDHAYNSSFSKDFVGNPDGSSRTNTERVMYAFTPLVGLTGTPKDLFGGNVTGSLKYGTATTYDLNISASPPSVTQTQTADIAFSLNYGRHGFSLPFFGVNLVNDVDITMTYSVSKNSRRLFDPTSLDENPDGTPLEGTTRTTMEPRFRYGLSSRVNASLFYRYSKIAPDEGGSTIFGTTTNEAGVDIHISIQ